MNSKHCRCFIILILTPILFIAVFNWIIDPFDIFISPRWDNVNKIKIAYKNQERLESTIGIAKRKPDAIFLGSSRVKAGFNSDSLKEKYRHIYNAGFSGASIEEVYHYFEHARHYQPHLTLVVLGIDLFSFNKNNSLKPDFYLEQLKEGTLNIKHRLALWFSKKALKYSFLTLKENFYPSLPEPPMEDIEYIKHVFYQQRELYGNYALDNKKIEYFRKIVETCKKNRIELKVFFCPCKAIYWEAHYRQLWSHLEKIKYQLCHIYPIWDFSGFNENYLQKIVPVNDQLYIDCGHFSPCIGNYILDRLFDHPQKLQNFGYYLTPQTIDLILTQIRKDRKAWLATKPKLLKELDLVIHPLKQPEFWKGTFLMKDLQEIKVDKKLNPFFIAENEV